MKVKQRVMSKLSKIIFILFFVGNIFAQSEYREAVSAYNDGHFETAAALFEKYLNTNPANIALFQYLANCYLSLHKIDKAALTLEKALKVQPGNKATLLSLIQVYASQKMFSRSEELLNKLIKNFHSDTEVKEVSAKIYYNCGLDYYSKKKSI